MDFKFDLKDYRLNKLKDEKGKPLTQEELAKMINDSQEQISRWENNPDSLTLTNFLRICTALGMKTDQVLNDYFELTDPEPLNFGHPYFERDIRKELFQNYCKPILTKDNIKTSDIIICRNLLSDLDILIKNMELKPFVAIVGRSDTGKTRLAKALTGIDDLITSWTPTTSIVVTFIHKENKPNFIKHDVTVFRGDEKDVRIGFDFRDYKNEEAYYKWRIDNGELDLLEKYGTHMGEKNRDKIARSALVFVDNPILSSCNLIDFPGYGSAIGILDKKMSLSAIDIADYFIFLSLANSFMGELDLIHLKYILSKSMDFNIKGGESNAFNNILIVASQAHIIGDEEKLSKILNIQSKLIYDQLHESIFKNINNIGCDPTYENFRNRFTTYTIDNKSLRNDFEKKLNASLQIDLPNYFVKLQEKQILEFKDRAKSLLDEEIKKYNTVLQEREKCKQTLKKAKMQMPSKIEELDALKQELIDLIKSSKANSKNEFTNWWEENINTESIIEVIRKRYGKNKKEAQKHIASNILDKTSNKSSKIIEKKMEKVSNRLDELFKKYKELTRSFAFNFNNTETEIPFDFQGALAGSISAASILGGLSIWAASLGNLGWYIIAAKGVSLLSSLSISVGGVATVVSLLSTIGGPITVAAGLAILVGLGIMTLFGSSWEKRLAKALLKELNKKGINKRTIYEEYTDQFDKFWNDTIKGLNEVVDNLKDKIKEYVDDLNELITSTNQRTIEEKIKKVKEYRDFFGGLPWDPIFGESEVGENNKP